MGMFNNFYNGMANLTGVNTGWLCLIPKKNEALSANDFRPISLIHSVAKLISKVLASRLQTVLGQLINPYQAAFLKGRHISDNFNCAHILVHHLYTNKQRAALLKIDFERAFDQVDWSFLLNLLQARGFSQRWIAWIRSILYSASTLIQIAVTERLLPNVGIGNARLHTLQFADDLIIFFDGSTRSAEIVKLILDNFAGCSGLTINYNKSSVTPINMPDAQASSLVTSLGCPEKEFPLNYLGLPLSPKRLRRADYMPLIEKITTVWTHLLQHHLTTHRALLALPGDLPARWNRARISIRGRRRIRGFDTLLTSTCWELWKERNKRIFDNQLSRSDEIERKVIDTMALWQRALGT
uniref:Reverse transcriptase domain-containing protein n=1 Tax=Ananas comosus var. bracteatus TaxID=296719 RepID=A0A6V7P9P9_ANACO|nr:unnamed protein product [Ananas comosus var. bracteatus]